MRPTETDARSAINDLEWTSDVALTSAYLVCLWISEVILRIVDCTRNLGSRNIRRIRSDFEFD